MPGGLPLAEGQGGRGREHEGPLTARRSPAGPKCLPPSSPIVVTLRDCGALADYLRHPVHLRAVEEVLRPSVAGLVFYVVVLRP